MSNIIIPESFSTASNEGVAVVLTCPNPALLTKEWTEIIGWVNRAKSKRQVLHRLRDLARDYGEINRGYSYKLPTKYVAVLQKRMTEIERITRYIIKREPDMKKEFKDMIKAIRGHFSGKNATNVKRTI